MKRIVFLFFFLGATLNTHSAFAQDTIPPGSASHAEAESVMNRYFGALVDGDIAVLKTVLGGNLLEKRNPLLDNPDYAGYLSTTYLNATFEILRVDTANPDAVVIDALIKFGQDESIPKRYILRMSASGNGVATYRIIRETSAARAF